MPRVHFVKKARKDDKAHGIRKGDSYYWWAFRVTSGKSYVKRVCKSKTRPKPSQLTQSEFLQNMYGCQEEVEEYVKAFREDADFDALADNLRSVAEQVREHGDNEQSKFDNMPEGLQQGESGQQLEARAQACEQIADELETAADAVADAKPETDDGGDEAEVAEKVDEAASAAEDVSWDFE